MTVDPNLRLGDGEDGDRDGRVGLLSECCISSSEVSQNDCLMQRWDLLTYSKYVSYTLSGCMYRRHRLGDS